jgi:purine-binding chemotaxis protein CheW
MTSVGQVVTLGVGEDLFAIPVTNVQEILDTREIARLPNAPPHLLGVIDVRGGSVAVVDLRAMLGLPAAARDVASRILVLRFEVQGHKAVIALQADRVFEVTELDGNDAPALGETGILKWDARIVAGIGRLSGRFVTVLNLEAMFGADLLTAQDLTKAA